MKRVVITSKNPVKENTVKNALSQIFPDVSFEYISVSVPSEVADQPMTSEETLQGALNRIKNGKKEVPDADFWVGLEGGVAYEGEDLYAFAWIVFDDGKVHSKSRTADFKLPPKVVGLIKEGYELGVANDMVFNQSNSKHSLGAVGILTNGMITRTSYYEQAAILALIPFSNKELY